MLQLGGERASRGRSSATGEVVDGACLPQAYQQVGTPLGVADIATPLVECVVHGLRRMLRCVSGAGRRARSTPEGGERRQRRAVALSELRPSREEHGTRRPVLQRGGAALRRRAARRASRSRARAQPRRRSCPRQVPRLPGCASRSPHATRAPLPLRGQGTSSLRDEHVRGKAIDLEAGRRFDRQCVCELKAFVDGDQLVLAVFALRPDEEREVDLRRRSDAVHVSKLGSCATPSGASCSARVPGPCPGGRERADGLFARRVTRQFERGGERLPTMGKRGLHHAFDRVEIGPGQQPGEGDEQRVDSGPRTEHRGGTACVPVRRADSWTSTETAPYAFVPGRRRTARPLPSAPSRTTP